MKTATVFINVNKNCLQDVFCIRDYVAVSRRFCQGGAQVKIRDRIDNYKISNATQMINSKFLCIFNRFFFYSVSRKLQIINFAVLKKLDFFFFEKKKNEKYFYNNGFIFE